MTASRKETPRGGEGGDSVDVGSGSPARPGNPGRPAEPGREPQPPPDVEPAEFEFLVRGQVLYRHGLPLVGTVVRAFHKELRAELPLGDARTDDTGNYEIYYSAEQLPGKAADLLTRAYDEKGEALAESPVRFSAGRIVKLRLQVEGGPEKTWSEYEQLASEVEPLLEGVAIADLVETPEQHDVSLLAGKVAQPVERVAALVVAHKLAARTGVAPEVFYGLARQNVATNLSALLEAGPDMRKDALETAVRRRIVPGRLVDQIDDVEQQVRRSVVELSGKDPSLPLGQILGTTLRRPGDRQHFLDLYLEHEGTPEEFWKSVENDKQVGKRAPELQLTLQLAALTAGHTPLMEAIRKRRDLKALPQLARLDGEEWAKLIRSSGAPKGELVPAEVPGKTLDERIGLYAETLQRIVADAAPSEAYAYHAAADDHQPDDARAFWGNVTKAVESGDTSFQLGSTDIAHYLEQNDGLVAGVRDRDRLVATLKTDQRLFNLTTRPSEIAALRGAGIGSATDVTRLGADVFAQRLGGDLGETRARLVYNQAEHVTATAVALLGEFGPQFNQVTLNAIAAPDPKQNPTLASLFGSFDMCECSECRSVDSPAAYFAEILGYLRDRTLTPPPPSGETEALQVLFERRPDLGQIELSCDNTNTVLPYIDLVNEVLERAVSPFAPFDLADARAAELDARTVSQDLRDAFAAAGPPLSDDHFVVVVKADQEWILTDHSTLYAIERKSAAKLRVASSTYQTSATPPQLEANPEHIWAPAYPVLRDAVYPWSLPFDQWREEVVTYLGHLGSERHELMVDYAPADPWSALGRLEIAVEQLGLNPKEREVVTGALAGVKAWDYYGLAQNANAVTVFDPANPATPAPRSLGWQQVLAWVGILLERSRTTYEELITLLERRNVNPGGTVRVVSADPADPTSCELEKLQLTGADAPFFDRLHRFVVLWRRLGWTPQELDLALDVLQPGVADPGDRFSDDLLVALSGVKRLRARTGLPLEELLSFWGPISTADSAAGEHDSLYLRLFQNPAVLSPVDPDLALLGEEPAVVTEEPADAKISTHAATLLAAFGVSATELAELAAALAPGDALDRASLSALYRHVLLARGLELEVADMLSLIAMSELDPFASPLEAVYFAELADRVATSTLSVAEIDYLLNHGSAERVEWSPIEGDVATLLDGLRTTLRRARAETAPRPDPTGDGTRATLTSLHWTAELVDQVIATLAGTATYRAALAALPGGLTVPAGLAGRVAYEAAPQELAITGPLTEEEHTELRNASGDGAWRTAVDELFAQPRQFVEQRMRAFEYPTFFAPLASLPPSVAFPDALSRRVYYDATTQQLGFAGAMTETEKSVLEGLSTGAAYRTAVQALYNAPLAYAPEPANAFFAAGEAGQLFDAARSPAERFELVLDRLQAHLRVVGSERAVVQGLGGALGLPPATAQALLGGIVSADGSPGTPAIEDFLADAFAASDERVAVTAAAFPSQFNTYTRLAKVVRLASELKLPPEQLQWLGRAAATVSAREVPWKPGSGETASWLTPDELPVAAVAPSAGRLSALLRVLDLVHLRDGLNGGFATLRTIVDAAHEAGATAPATLDLVTATAGWDRAAIEYLAGATVLDLAVPADLADETGLTRLYRALWRARRLSAGVEQCHDFAQPQLRDVDASAARQLAKARYSDAEWAAVARPLRDVLRERQRESLVDYLVARPEPAAGRDWEDADGLYAYFLIDPEMSPCALTSRIKQAIGSVQQFVQRCLLNLEEKVSADAATDPGWSEWKWMKNYRVWEASRKIFMYPENWLEVELREDKSPFFLEAESQLLQNEVTAEVAEDVFTAYLERLDDVARLEVASMYLEAAADGQPEVLHVFGRTFSADTPQHWYRRRVDGCWTAWERVDLDIAERQILPIVWNRRLYLFWLVFTEGAAPSYGEHPEPPSRYFDLQLAWSEYRRGKWQSRRVTTQKVRSLVEPDESYDHGKHRHVLRAGIDAQGLKLWYEFDDPTTFVLVPGTYGTESRWVNGAFVDGWNFTGRAGKTEPYQRVIQGIFQPTGTEVDGMAFDELLSQPLYVPKVLTSGEKVALNNTPGVFSLMYLHQDGYITGLRPFFYADDARTYLVESVEGREPAWWLTEPARFDLSAIDIIRRFYYAPVIVRDPEEIHAVGPATRWGVVDPVPIAQKVIDNATAYTERAAGLGVAEQAATPTLLAEFHPATLDMATTPTPFAEQKAPHTLSYDLDRSQKLIVAKGDREVLPIDKYIETGRIERPIWMTPVSRPVRRYEFKNFFHPYSTQFLKELANGGIDGLLERSTQLALAKTFQARYNPTDAVVSGAGYPVEDVDFSYKGAYSVYNWELFLHLPLLIATRLMQNQRFEEAQRWFHFIFDPTDTADSDTPRRFWRTRPFYESSQQEVLDERIDRIVAMLAEGTVDPELEAQVDAWRRNPFAPHAVARLRTAAYQKNVVMRYLDNLIAWGDQLFRRDTIESINEATQLYILAAGILGRRPAIGKPRAEPQAQTFDTLDPSVADFSDSLVDIEYLFGATRPDSVVSDPKSPPLPLPRMLYFCVPPNDKLLGYWDTVADRLFKIRHCMNIEGVVRQLPLFEPPLDPALLVRAAAAGVDISTALSDAAAPLPAYRFRALSAKAKELAGQVKALGAELYAALEGRDADQLALLRAGNTIAVEETTEQVRIEQLAEAKQQVETLRKGRAEAAAKYEHYQRLLGVQSPSTPGEGQPVPDVVASASFTITSDDGAKLTQQEDNELKKLASAKEDQDKAADDEHSAAIANIFPSINIQVTPWGVGIGTAFGGPNIGSMYSASASSHRTEAAQGTYDATRAAKVATYVLREQDWVLQSNLAAREIMYTDAQIAGALLRQEVAERELDSLRKQIDTSAAELELMTQQFSNEELRAWMIGKISEVYFQAYELAYEVAKRSERAYRFELGLTDSSFIQFGYWDSLKKGLLAGEQIELDIDRMAVSFLDLNRREHELTKHVSLNLLSPEALVELRETGSCFVELPEAIFDLDHPGHYMRRIKTLSLTIPCTTGPYSTVSCKLTQLANRVRMNASLTPQYGWRGFDDQRFAHDSGGVESIVTSSARDDSGLFQLEFGDERYLPFEGRGAVSSFRLELPAEFRQFDYETISDVVLHLRYTARDGGEALRGAAAGSLAAALKAMEVDEGSSGLFRLFMARSDYPDDFYQLLHPAPEAAGQQLSFRLGKDRFPAHVRDRNLKIASIVVFARLADGFAYEDDDPLEVTVKRPSGASADAALRVVEGEVGGLPSAQVGFGGTGVALSETNDWQILLKTVPEALGVEVEVDGAPVRRLNPDALADLGILCAYTF